MYTSVGLVAVVGLFLSPPAVDEAPSWRHNYSLARQEGQRMGKPLAVVVGSGEQGYHALAAEGQLSRTACKLLARHYIPVYVDLSTPTGQQLAEALALTEGVGLVLSDRSGQFQAFYHQGALADEDLVYYLRRFADPHRLVRTTEEVTSRVSSSSLASSPATAPVPSFVPAAPAPLYLSGSC